jgi:hypothetical protein
MRRRAQGLASVGRVREALSDLAAARGASNCIRARLHLRTWEHEVREAYPLEGAMGRAFFPVASTDGMGGGIFCVDIAAPGGFVQAHRPWGEQDERVERGLRAGFNCAVHRGLLKDADRARFVAAAPLVEVSPGLECADVQVEGRSLEAAVALALVSALAKRALDPARRVITGAVEGFHVQPVAEATLAAKRAAVRQAWGDEVELVAASPGESLSLPELAQTLIAFDALDRVDAQQLADLMNGRTGFGDWVGAAHAAERLLNTPSLTDEQRALAQGCLTSALNHQGRASEALDYALDDPEPGVETDDDRARRIGALAIAYLDIEQVSRGFAVVEAEIARRGGEASPDLKGLASSCLLGTLARLSSGANQGEAGHARAIELARLAADRALLEERPRNLGDLGLWLLRAGHPTEALEVLESAGGERVSRDAAGRPNLTDLYRHSFIAAARQALGRRVTLTEVEAALEAAGEGAPPVVLTWLQLAVEAGLNVAQQLEALDQRSVAAGLYKAHSVLARLRARVECARSNPNKGAIQKWSGPLRPDESIEDRLSVLRATLPY